MNTAPPFAPTRLLRFRTRLFLGMMVLVAVLGGSGVALVERKVFTEAEREWQKAFEHEIAALHNLQAVRHAALAERCRALVRRPRIHAALEDNALDLLYLSARDELRDLTEEEQEPGSAALPQTLHARFYRFLDNRGAVISAPGTAGIGELTPREEGQLSLSQAPKTQAMGYLLRGQEGTGGGLDEIVAMPIVSSETGEVIAALVLGFKALELGRYREGLQSRTGICLGARLYLPGLSEAAQLDLGARVTQAAKSPEDRRFPVQIEGRPHLLFYSELNAGSVFPSAYEVIVYPLSAAQARQHQLRWQVLAASALLLGGGFVGSHFLAARLARPVEKLEVDSEEDRVQRARVEAALEMTSVELERAARFSADASHQLKTPVTVLRAGLEELIARPQVDAEMREELSALVHQTFRLTCIVEDLLLLSRMDAGRLQLRLDSVALSPLLEALMDDLSALPDTFDLSVGSDCAPLQIAGEKRYVTLILQNLLENARKYNRPGGTIRIACREEGEWGLLSIANTGRPIPLSAQEHIFERFHRGSVGENVPGHGLGLNLARELARLHGGDLRLIRSDDKWTQFEVRFRIFTPAPTRPAPGSPGATEPPERALLPG